MHIISGDLWAGAEVQAYTLLKHLQAEVDLYVVLMNQGELSEKLTALGIETVVIPETNLSSLSLVSKLITQIRRFRPDVIHTHRQKENILGSLANLACVPFNLKLIASVRTTHGAPEFNPKGKQKIQAWLDRFVGRYLQKKVIAVSEDLATKLTALYPPQHVEVIQNGVDVETLKELAKTPAEFRLNAPNKTHIGIIGRLEPVKRVDIFLDMAAILLREGKMDWQFHVIGDGRLRPELENQAAVLGISSYVTFHGHRKDIPSCIAALDAIIMCSDHEGTPMTALEALALGTRLIAHDVGGLREILKDSDDSRVKNHQPQEYAKFVTRIIEHRLKPERLLPEFSAITNMKSTLSSYRLTLK